jgi:protocatechuate 3,4-dioxygenase alpha subunit
MELHPTPSQTVGPFFSLGLSWMGAHELVDPAQPGAVVLFGRVLDGASAPVPDAVIEIFQADAAGRFPPDTDDPWTGFGRSLSDGDGAYRFVTCKPGSVGAEHAPHIDVSVFARGLLQRVVTRCYFPDETKANRGDPVLCAIDDDDVVASLIALSAGEGLRFDIRLQGAGETGFFAW